MAAGGEAAQALQLIESRHLQVGIGGSVIPQAEHRQGFTGEHQVAMAEIGRRQSQARLLFFDIYRFHKIGIDFSQQRLAIFIH